MTNTLTEILTTLMTDPDQEHLRLGLVAWLNLREPTPVKPEHLPNWLRLAWIRSRLRTERRDGVAQSGWAVAMEISDWLKHVGAWPLDHWGSTEIDGSVCFVSELYCELDDGPELFRELAVRTGCVYAYSRQSYHGNGTVRALLFPPPAPVVASPAPRGAAEVPAPAAHHRMPFGKYKDQPVNAVPTTYLRWVLREGIKVSRLLREAIVAEVQRRPDGKMPLPEDYPQLNLPHGLDADATLRHLADYLQAAAHHAKAAGMAHSLLLTMLRQMPDVLRETAYRVVRQREASSRRFDYEAFMRVGGHPG